MFGSSPEFFHPEKSLLKKGRILLADHHVAFAQITHIELINLCVDELFKSEVIDNYKFIPIWSDSDLSELIQNSKIRPALIERMVQVRDSTLNRWREQETFQIQVPENWEHLTFSDPTVAYLRPTLKQPFSLMKDLYIQVIARELEKPIGERFEIPYDPLDESSITFTAHASRYDQIRMRSNLHYLWFRLFLKRIKPIECMTRWDHKKDQSDLYIDGYLLGPLERKSKPKATQKLIQSK